MTGMGPELKRSRVNEEVENEEGENEDMEKPLLLERNRGLHLVQTTGVEPVRKITSTGF